MFPCLRLTCLGGGIGNSDSDPIVLSYKVIPAPDYYVAEGGSDSNAGTSEEPFLTIAHAVSVAIAAGDNKVIKIADGTYVENLVITENITLIGNIDSPENVIIKPSTANGTAVSVSANSLLAICGVTLKTSAEELSITSQSSDLSGRGYGISTTDCASIISLWKVTIDGFTYGISSYGETTLNLEDSTIQNTTYKGIYAKKLASADFKNVKFINNATATTLLPDNDPNSRSGSAIDFNLINACDHISFTECTFDTNGDINGSTSGAIKIKIRGGTEETDGQYSSSGSITNGVSITNCIFTDNPRDVVLGTKACPKSSDDFTVKYSGGSPIREYNFAVNDSSAKDGIESSFFANGKPITISADNDKTKISWDSGAHSCTYSADDAKKLLVFGGSKNASVDSTSITMANGNVAYLYGGGYGTSESTKAEVTGTANISLNDGTLTTIYGGGLLYSTVVDSNITMTGGTITFIMGGGACSATGMPSPGTSENPYTTISGTASINISNGTAKYVMGGGQGYSHVNNAEIKISGNANITELIAGGSNGSTKPTASIEINGGTIGMVFSVNRGSLENPTITVTDGNIINLYVGASQNSSNTKGVVTGTATLKVTGGNITNMYLGTGLDNASVDLTLRDEDIIIAAGGHAFDDGEDFTEHNGSTTYTVVNTYTITSGKTWVVNGGMLNLSDATLTNNGKLTFDNSSVGENGLVVKNIKGTGDLEIKNISFAKKGLIVDGTNNSILITGCNFTSISDEQLPYLEKYPGYYVNAILINKCTGNVTIGGDDAADKNTISNVSKEDDKSNPGRGIYIESSGAADKSLIIKNNNISGIAYNAIQIINLKYSEITVSNNIIDNWDSDKDCVSEAQIEEGKVLQAGGRAIRLSLSAGTTSDISIENNTFVMTYSSNVFSPNIGSVNVIGYDDGNILKSNAAVEFKNNILALSGIDSYSYADMFITGSDADKKLMIFDPNGGYFYTTLQPGVKCSILAVGDTVSKPTTNPSRSGSYSFVDWYTEKTGGNICAFPITVTDNVTMYAKWSYTGGSGIPTTPPTVDPEPEPIIPDGNNNVTVPTLDEKKTEELIHEAVSSGSNSITIIDTSDVKGDYTTVTISKSDLETITKSIENNNNIDSVSIPTSEGDIIIEKEVLSSILENTDADSVSFEVEDAKNKLTEEQKKAVGDRPVYDINIKAGNENVTSFNGKSIAISLPYTLKAGEDPENIVVYYVKEDGSLEKMNCTYKDGKVIFDTDHLSKYVIGYEESDKPVTPDTPDNKKDDNNNTIYYAVAAVIVILIIIALAYYFMKKKQ